MGLNRRPVVEPTPRNTSQRAPRLRCAVWSTSVESVAQKVCVSGGSREVGGESHDRTWRLRGRLLLKLKLKLRTELKLKLSTEVKLKLRAELKLKLKLRTELLWVLSLVS